MSHVCSTLLSDCNTLMMQYINESWLQYIIEWLQYINDAIHEWPTLSIRTCQGRDLLRWAVLSQGCLCVCVGVCVCVCERERVSEIFWGELRCRKCACVCVCVCVKERERERDLLRWYFHAQTLMSHFTHSTWVMSYESCHKLDMGHVTCNTLMSHVTHSTWVTSYESCHKLDMGHVICNTLMSHVTQPTWVMSHESMSHFRHESCHTSHMKALVSHRIHEWVRSHAIHEW